MRPVRVRIRPESYPMSLSPSGGPFFVSSKTGGRAATIRRLGNAWSGRTPRLAIPCAQRPAGPPWERAGPWPSAHRRPPGTQTRRRREAATGCNEGRRAEPGSWPAVSRTRAGSGASTEIPRLCGPAARRLRWRPRRRARCWVRGPRGAVHPARRVAAGVI